MAILLPAVRKLLRMYGAIFSEEDEARWRGIMAAEEAYFAGLA